MGAKANRTLELIKAFPDSFGLEPLREQSEKTGKLFLRGIMQKADTLNQNGRIYPRAILEREIRNYQKFVIENRATGELDHPDSSVVSLRNVSHIVREIYLEGDTVYGTIEVLDKVPNGQILKGLIESGVKIGISSRGVGSTKKDGDYQVVQDDFQIICFDTVSEPSTPNAFMLPESRNGRRIVTPEELDELKVHFKKSDRIYRVLNDILV